MYCPLYLVSMTVFLIINPFLGIGTFMYHFMPYIVVCCIFCLHPAGIKCGLVIQGVFRSVSLDLTGYVYSYGPLEDSKFIR